MSIPSPTSARLLDAGYTVIYIAANLFALYVVRASGKTSARSPQGHYFLEPLYSILQALVVLAAALIWRPLSLIREGFIELSGGVFFPGSKKEQIRQAVKKQCPKGTALNMSASAKSASATTSASSWTAKATTH